MVRGHLHCGGTHAGAGYCFVTLIVSVAVGVAGRGPERGNGGDAGFSW
jgi:hypothetical protein